MYKLGFGFYTPIRNQESKLYQNRHKPGENKIQKNLADTLGSALYRGTTLITMYAITYCNTL